MGKKRTQREGGGMKKIGNRWRGLSSQREVWGKKYIDKEIKRLKFMP